MGPTDGAAQPGAVGAGRGFAVAPRTYVHDIQLPQAVERLSPKQGSLFLHGLTSAESREGD